MKTGSQKSKVRNQKPGGFRVLQWTGLCLLLSVGGAIGSEDFSTLCADRTAIERVYYSHRLGNKPPFGQTLPPAVLENLVRLDLKKEAVLQKTYGVVITPTLLNAEVQRINSTTRAPDVLAEIKAALDNDTNRFAQTVAKPILVERLLRDKFENDDALHAATRHEVEKVRAQLTNAVAEFRRSRGDEAQTSNPQPGLAGNLIAILKAGHSNEVSEATWQLDRRPTETNARTADEIEIKKRFGPDAQLLSAQHRAESEPKFYFEDVPAELQRVLQVQLRQPGDVSAVIETPGGFLLYVCKEKTSETFTVACLSLPKRNYEQWLEEQK